MMKNLVVYGAGAHAKSLADILLSVNSGDKILFLGKPNEAGMKVLGYPVVDDLNINEPYEIIIGIGDNSIRKRVFEKNPKANFFNVIAKTAYISPFAKIGKGVFIGNNVHIGPDAIVGDNVIINNGAIVEHDVVVGNHTHIGPGAAISSNVTIGESVFIGTNAAVKNRVSICNEAIIGAGAAVVKDVIAKGIWIGVPAKKLVQ